MKLSAEWGSDLQVRFGENIQTSVCWHPTEYAVTTGGVKTVPIHPVLFVVQSSVEAMANCP